MPYFELSDVFFYARPTTTDIKIGTTVSDMHVDFQGRNDNEFWDRIFLYVALVFQINRHVLSR